MLNGNDEKFMQRCYELAVSAGKKGYDTFGAVLVNDGKIIEEAENTSDYKLGLFGHAEFNLVHKLANRYSDEFLANSVLYTSCAPCERCLMAIASLGIHRIVCGVSYQRFQQMIPYDGYVPDYEGILKQMNINIQMEGPIKEDEGMHVFEYWGGEYHPLKELIAEMDEIKKKERRIYTERLILEVASDEIMETMIADEKDEELKQAYTEMYEGTKSHPNERDWHAIWLLKLKEHPEITVGDMCFKGITEDGMVEIGYGMHPEYEGQGYMTEAVREISAWAVRREGVSQVEAETNSDNRASQRVLEKAGFRPNGVIGEEGPRFVFLGDDGVEKD